MQNRSAAPEPSILHVPGLTAEASIAVDRWGVPHIRAESEPDLFFVQGFNAARDRLWQIDLWRKRGLGLLAADFGPGYLEQDRAARLFLYRGDMAPEWAAYAPDAEAICTAFATGVNAYIVAAQAGRMPMPPEFALMGTQPMPWSPEDVVRIRSHCLTRNALNEVLRARTLAEAGPEADRMRAELVPPVEAVFDPEVPPEAIPLETIEDFKLATASVTFSHDRLNATLDEAPRWRTLNTLGEVVAEAESQGSNNWAVSGARTATGRPVMGTDPHRTHALPSLRYIVHLSAPGLDVIGAGEPSVPGISLGHNGHSAFSLTIFGADQEDMLVYRRDPEAANRYAYGDGKEEVQEVSERFAVRGYPDQTKRLRFTRHGPVVHETPERLFAIRTVWSDPGAAPYMASLSVMRAKSWDSYRVALKGWGTPSINHVYADVTGDIGWQTVGTTPRREGWNGLLPVPGDGRYEWQGKLSLDELPHVLNPARGFVATANEMNLPDGWDAAAAAVGYEWVDRSRADRIHAVLDDQTEHDIADSCALQTDLHSAAAVRMQRVLAGLVMDGDAADAAAHLAVWDARVTADSSQALFFEYWVTRHLKPALFTALIGPGVSIELLWPGSIQSVLDLVERPEHWFAKDAEETRDAILRDSLTAAWADSKTRFGADVASWHWGAIHRLPLPHALEAVNAPAEWSVGPFEIGGSGSTPAYANYRIGDFTTITGPSVRIVMDVGAWDNSVFINLPGQSGMPGNPHFADLADDWQRGNYHPLLYSRGAVDAATEIVLRLLPGDAP
ncbi:Penicillin acylase 2 proenzyme (plasmid) [Sulfitobacter indolifex]|uniref:penicillin acylase family protein n=1 Tax=Sulfitobacter indolifex TaxID=225422 RepID=UPI001FAD678D|nr:penicillin acylase family protein [Sulfitobacter indolifex]UOA20608.1 Penicillin acylase 2 proenzyme [Sulfitobacter indolifex]UOA20823.1 Penicillin acylase 2 proenzyme [Sulfitobacter indolifex]